MSRKSKKLGSWAWFLIGITSGLLTGVIVNLFEFDTFWSELLASICIGIGLGLLVAILIKYVFRPKKKSVEEDDDADDPRL